jgi:putative inorganic carbon (hco3(-)) transporter
MDERLVFGFGTSGRRSDTRARAAAEPVRMQTLAAPPAAPARGSKREPSDWAFTGLMAFTALLFLRPQDHFPVLGILPLAEIAAILGLIALVSGRLRRGLLITRLTPELLGVIAVGLIILATAPFSVWMGGAVGTFTDLYAKVILIFALMTNTLISPKRLERFTWLIVLACAYIASRAVLDYARGVNLIEYGRVQGALGGIFRNPNDLALNMVSVLPLTVMLAFRTSNMFKRTFTLGCAVVMIATIVASQSRSGTVGLAVMMLCGALVVMRRRPGLVFSGALLLVLAMPLAPDSYWERISSITDSSKDDTGSRQARNILLRESWATFVAHPLTGVGAGQFKNYNPEERVEAWRESHNVLLQVAAELGILGLMAFTFLLVRAGSTRRQTRQLLRRITSEPRRPRDGPHAVDAPLVTPAEAAQLDSYALAMAASLAGWFTCAMFASVAYNWTFYYLLAMAVAPREILLDRLAAAVPRRARFSAPIAVQEARA